MVSLQCGLGYGLSSEIFVKMLFRKCHKQMVSLQCGLSGGHRKIESKMLFHNSDKQNGFSPK